MTYVEKLIEGLQLLKEHANATDICALHKGVHVLHDELNDPTGEIRERLRELGFYDDDDDNGNMFYFYTP